PSPPGNNFPRKFFSPRFLPHSRSASLAPKTLPPSASGPAPAPFSPTSPSWRHHSPEWLLCVQFSPENCMNRKSILLTVLLCSLYVGKPLFAQTPPAQKPEIEIPHAQTACDCHDLDSANARISRMEGALKDWPNLARYREANSNVKPP